MAVRKVSKSSSPPRGSIDVYAAQCDKCYKWRKIDTQKEFEDIRSKFNEEPFYCKKKSGVSCEDPADINYDASRIWVMDKPNIPITPKGFKRSLILRKDFSKLDAYYITPAGKRAKMRSEIMSFLEENPDYKDVSISDFDFATPKIMEETLPKDVVKARGKDKKGKNKKPKAEA